MFCGSRPAAQGARHRQLLQQSEAKVFGTWDFKWAQGTKIRVAFQELQSAVGVSTRELVREVRPICEAWLRPLDSSRRANISFEFLEQLWPAPSTPDGAKSPGAPEGQPEYDVLVSFAPLPVVEPPSEAHDQVRILYPSSQLGSYAKRVDAGVPTMYLGPTGNLVADPRAYFNSNEFRYCVAHEFGHVLGMAHEHQNPLARVEWKKVDEIIAILEATTGIAGISRDFVETAFLLPWPSSQRGDEILFSDWRRYPADGPSALDSVMLDPLWKCLVQSADPKCLDDHKRCTCTTYDQPLPTDGDRLQLWRMYPGRP